MSDTILEAMLSDEDADRIAARFQPSWQTEKNAKSQPEIDIANAIGLAQSTVHTPGPRIEIDEPEDSVILDRSIVSGPSSRPPAAQPPAKPAQFPSAPPLPQAHFRAEPIPFPAAQMRAPSELRSNAHSSLPSTALPFARSLVQERLRASSAPPSAAWPPVDDDIPIPRRSKAGPLAVIGFIGITAAAGFFAVTRGGLRSTPSRGTTQIPTQETAEAVRAVPPPPAAIPTPQANDESNEAHGEPSLPPANEGTHTGSGAAASQEETHAPAPPPKPAPPPRVERPVERPVARPSPPPSAPRQPKSGGIVRDVPF